MRLMRLTRVAEAAFAAGLSCAMAACTKPPPSSSSADAESPTRAASSAPASSSSAPSTALWTGTYVATPGTLSVPDGGEWAGWKFHGDDASAGLGEGTLSLTVDSVTGRALGSSEGPLGALVISGVLKDGELDARLDPKDARAVVAGFTGYAQGKREGEGDGARLAGTMRLSAPTGDVLRAGTFQLARK